MPTRDADAPPPSPPAPAEVLECIAEGVSVVAPDGTLGWANPAGRALLDELSGDAGGTVRDGRWGAMGADGVRVPAEHLPAEITRTTGVECSGVEIGFPTRGGGLRWLSVSTRRLSGDGPPFGVVCSYADVTAAHSSADALRRAEDRHRSTLESLHEGVLVLDPAGLPVSANRRAHELLGVGEAELSARGTADPRWCPVSVGGTALAPDELPTRRAQATGRACLDEVIGISTPSGSRRWLLVNAVPLPGDGPTPAGVVASFVDVTDRHEAHRLRAAGEEHFRALAEDSADVVSRIGPDGRYRYVSPAARRVYGRAPEELVGQESLAFVHPDDHLTLRRMRRRLLRGGPPETARYRVRHADGRWLWIEGAVAAVFGDDGTASWLQVAARDVTAQREQEEALRQANARFEGAFLAAPIGMALVGLDGSWLDVNPAFCEMVGYDRERLRGMRFQDITHPDDVDPDVGRLQDAVATGAPAYRAAKRYLHADGHTVHVLLAGVVIAGPSGAPSHILCHIQDVSEHHALEERLRLLAERDDLTGLMNRRRFEEELVRQIERCARSGERAALALIDLDRFKAVNDSEGHVAGDELLRRAALAMAGRSRASDILARLGGDEFALILAGADAPSAARACVAIGEAVRVACAREGVTASIGIAPLAPGDTPRSALERADAAMYAAKQDGRDRVRLHGDAMAGLTG